MIKTPLSALTLSICLALPAAARDPAPATVEVLQGWELPNGRRVAALQVTLQDGWKTYWRAPGDSGIPPQFNWNGARNIGDLQITWPQPKVFHDDGSRSIGYKGQLVIPLHIAPKRDGQPIRLKGRMDIGVCSDVCAPFTLKFDTVLEAAGPVPTPSIASAMASAPYSASEAGVRAATCHITPIDEGLQIEARVTMPSAGGREEAVIEAGQDAIWVSEPETRRSGNQIIAVSQMYHSAGPAFSVNRSDVRITILGSNHSVDIRGCSAG
jgi:DsbC/DsbD-like thiol-disulfide interchange protein